MGRGVKVLFFDHVRYLKQQKCFNEAVQRDQMIESGLRILGGMTSNTDLSFLINVIVVDGKSIMRFHFPQHTLLLL